MSFLCMQSILFNKNLRKSGWRKGVRYRKSIFQRRLMSKQCVAARWEADGGVTITSGNADQGKNEIRMTYFVKAAKKPKLISIMPHFLGFGRTDKAYDSRHGKDIQFICQNDADIRAIHELITNPGGKPRAIAKIGKGEEMFQAVKVPDSPTFQLLVEEGREHGKAEALARLADK